MSTAWLGVLVVQTRENGGSLGIQAPYKPDRAARAEISIGQLRFR